MTVTTTTTRTTYTGNGVTKVFSTAWYFTREDDVRVTVDGVLKTRGTHYTVQLPTAVDAAGSVTFVTAPDAAAEVVVQRRVSYVQDTSYRTQGSYSRAAQEDSMDRLGFQTQQLAADVATLAAGGDPGIADDVAQLQNDVTTLQTTASDNSGAIAALDTRVDALEAATIPALSDAAPAAVAAAADPGDAATASRANHVHAHGAQALGDGTNHATATETTAGFASPELVQKVNGAFAEQVHIIDWRTTDATPTQVLTYMPADGTFERVKIEAVAFNADGTKYGAWSSVLTPSDVIATDTGTGAKTDFTFPYWINVASALTVKVNGVTKTLGTDYTVTLPAGTTLGKVVFAVAPGSGLSVEISAPSTQPFGSVTRVAGSTTAAAIEDRPMQGGDSWALLLDASSPAVRLRVRGGAYAVRWRIEVRRLVVALA